MGQVNITFADVTQRSKTFLLEMLEAKSGATSNKLSVCHSNTLNVLQNVVFLLTDIS